MLIRYSIHLQFVIHSIYTHINSSLPVWVFKYKLLYLYVSYMYTSVDLCFYRMNKLHFPGESKKKLSKVFLPFWQITSFIKLLILSKQIFYFFRIFPHISFFFNVKENRKIQYGIRLSRSTRTYVNIHNINKKNVFLRILCRIICV